MTVPKRFLLLASAAFTFFSFRYAHAAAIFPGKYILNTTTVFLVLLHAQWTWSIVVYPLFLSPLRHLPQPPVSFKKSSLCTTPCAHIPS
jgi:hypothetical protein